MGRIWKLDLTRNVRNILPQLFGGTGNRKGWSTGVVQPMSNGENDVLAVGSVVSLKAGYDDLRVIKTTTADATDVAGVVVGRFDYGPDGYTFEAANAAADDLVAVMSSGVCLVNIGTSVTRGQYAYVHTTDGSAKSSATLSAGAFGRFVDSASSGQARVQLGVFAGNTITTPVTYGTPAIVLGTAAAAGSIAEAIRRDATIVAFDGTTPAALTIAGSGATGSAAVAARRDHGHAVTGDLDDLADVAASAPADGDVLTYSGGSWINQAPADADLIWRPLMDGAIPGTIILDGATGEAIMALGPQ